MVAISITFLFVTLLSLACTGESITCKDSSQANVDWWLIVKLPHGSEYVYVDSTYIAGPSGGLEWTLQNGLNRTVGNPLAGTLQQLYSGSPAGYVMYNDEWPNGTVSFHLAHAKGVLGFEKDGGFWLVHSAPKFPNNPTDGPYTGICCEEYWGQLLEGQNFMCLTLGPTQLNSVAALLQLPSLFLYEWHMPLWSTLTYPAITKLVSGGFPGLATQASQPIATVGGEPFMAFAKATTPLHGIGIYEDVIEPFLKAGMEVQSWLNGRNALPSQCPPTTQYESLNVRHVYIRVASRGWDNTVDHSKWLSWAARKMI
ncbi:g11061 [Coccomyxa elongata]